MGSEEKDLLRQNKETLLREHFHAVLQLAFTYLKDKTRAQAVSKAVFCRAFDALDEGEDMVEVSLELRGFTLEEVLRLKEEEPSPAVDVYQGAAAPYGTDAPPYNAYGQPPYYYGAYMQPYAPYPQSPYPPYPYPPYPQYAPPAYPQGANDPQMPYPPQGAAPQAGAAQTARAADVKEDHSETVAQTKGEAAQPLKGSTKPRAEEAKTPGTTPVPGAAQAKPEPEIPKAEEPVEEEPDLGPAPYEGPTEEEKKEAPVPHAITMTPEMQARRRKRARNARIILALNIIAVSAMIWIVLGLLHRIGIFPNLDLGYTWFNTNLFKMF